MKKLTAYAAAYIAAITAANLARWLDRRRLEHDDPRADAGASLGALWALWLAEHDCGVADLDYTERAA